MKTVKTTAGFNEENATPELRPFGLCHGEFTVPDDFDELLPDSFLDAFEGILTMNSPQEVLNFSERPQ